MPPVATKRAAASQGVQSSQKKTRTTTTKKRTTTKKPTGVIMVKVPKPWPFPPMLQNTLVYAQQRSFALTLGAFRAEQFRANGLFDPWVETGGTQPLYFDQLSGIYDHFTVISSYIEVQPLGIAATQNQLSYGLYIDDDTSTVANFPSLMQRPGAVYKVVCTTTDTPQPIRIGWSAEKTFGNPKPWTDPELQGTSSADPTEQSFFTIGMVDSTLQTTTYLLSVKVTYNVVWDELKTVGES